MEMEELGFLSDFRLCYKVIVIKTIWCWHKNRNMAPFLHRTGSREVNSCAYGHLIKHTRAFVYTNTQINKGGKNV